MRSVDAARGSRPSGALADSSAELPEDTAYAQTDAHRSLHFVPRARFVLIKS